MDKEKIKVVNIISTMNDGGAEKIALNYLRYFKNDKDIDFKLIVINKDFRKNNNKIIKKEKLNAEYLQNDLINMIPLVNKIHTLKRTKKLVKKALEKNKPDIVHIHITGLLKETLDPIIDCNIPIRFDTLHSNPLRYNGELLEIAKMAFLKENVIPICLNHEQAKVASEHYGFDKYEIVYNGIDIKKIKNNIISKLEARKKFNIADDTFLIVGVGRLEKIKQFEILISALELICKKRDNVKLILAGQGRELKNLQKLAKEKHVEDKVIFTGNINNVTTLYCAADVLGMTSKSEASPLVLIESQACDLRSVVSSGVPTESIVTNKVNKMAENASIEDWANALLDDNFVGTHDNNIQNYELDNANYSMKRVYLKYWEDYNNAK